MVERREGTGPLVVMVHGAMDRASSFGRVARKLPDRPLLRYDRRGYGGSEPGRAVGLHVHVADLIRLLDGRDAIVLGHSYGGTVALAAAAGGASSIRAVAAYESPMPALAEVTPFPFDPDESPADVAERFMLAMVGERIWNRLPPRTRDDRRQEGPALIADLVAVREEAPSIDVAAIDVPVLVSAGALSGARTLARARALADALPLGELRTVENGDHGVHLGNPAGVAALVGELADRAEAANENEG